MLNGSEDGRKKPSVKGKGKGTKSKKTFNHRNKIKNLTNYSQDKNNF
jgi:hypothetical protein